MHEDEVTFFEKERDRLAGDVASGFESLLSSINVLNRKMEEVLGMTKEYETIASLWRSFHQLMRGNGSQIGDPLNDDYSTPGVPGTGGHVINYKKDGQL